MSRIPLAMRTNGRHVVPHFDGEEFLYRRVPLDLWDDPAFPVEVNAIELPDISVGRSRFGQPEWLRIGDNYNFDGWGVIGFQVQEIPPERWNVGVFHFTFETFHVPEEMTYPHSEVKAFENGSHIGTIETMPEEVHLEWRELLLRKVKTFLKPYQEAKTRQNAPVSHIPELPIPVE